MTTRTDPWTRLAHLWPLLALTRIPGTRRPWRAPELTGLQREQRDAQLRAEKLADTASYGPGLRWLARPGVIFASPHAPMHVDVLDVLAALHRQLSDAAMELGIWPQTLMLTSLSDPGPLLEACRDAARSQPDGIPVDHAAWDMLHTAEHVLGEIYDGQKLLADCPWCHGGTSRKPSWRIHMIDGGRHPRTGEMQKAPAIICESGTCEPPPGDADDWRGMPAWFMSDWEWLASRLVTEEQRQAERRAELEQELAGRKGCG